MKKVLSTVAAFGLAIGVASTASALDLTVTGHYSIDGMSVDWAPAAANGTAAGVPLTDPTTVGAARQNGHNSFMVHNFRMYPVLKVNDNITMKGDIRLISDENYSDTTSTATTQNAHKLWMEYTSPIGLWVLGKQPAGAWGSPFLNSATGAHRVTYVPNFVSSPWSLKLFVERNADDGGPTNNDAAGDDNNTYFMGVGHKSDAGKFDVAYQVIKNGDTNVDNVSSFDANNLMFNAVAPVGPVDVTFEINHKGGDQTATIDNDAWAAMLLVTGKVSDNLTAGVIAFMATGDEAGSANDDEAFMTNGLGIDFEPLYIMTGDYMGVLNGDGNTARIAESGVEAIGAFADLTVNPKLTLHAAIGMGQAEDLTAYEATNTLTNVDDDYGWEFNLGASYKLLDNLTYDLHFGYWDVGDFAKGGVATNNPTEVTLVSNSLTMKF